MTTQMLLANIGWSDSYDGQSMDWPDYERWNFKHYDDGFFRGILRGQSSDNSVPRPRITTGWTVIFIARRDVSSKSKIVGFYQDCELLEWEVRPEGELLPESRREYPHEEYEYNLKAPERSCFLLPTPQRPEFPWRYARSSFIYITEPDRPGEVKPNRGDEYQRVHQLLANFPSWRRHGS